MIKRFGFKNFSSFKDGAEISFELNGNTPEEIALGEPLSSVLGIKGANGSGKTNILKAITFLYCFCTKSMKTRKESSDGSTTIEIPLGNFFENKNVTEFYIEFIADKITYYYELDITKDGIIREEIRRKSTKEVKCILRENNKIISCLKEFSELKKLKLKSDQSLISLVSDYDFHNKMEDLENIWLHFKKILFNVGSKGYRTHQSDDFLKISEFYDKSPRALEFTKYIIMSVDNGITDIVIDKSIDKSSGKTYFFPTFIHKNNDCDHSIGLDDESMGTKSLFLHMYYYWLTISEGGLLVLDEFDTHLHAMILPELLNLFNNSYINKNKAQLIITAHNTEIIDTLGKYRTILVNKEFNESYCYRLDDVSMLRNDRPLSPYYTKGKIGGTPTDITGLTSRLAKVWSKQNNG